jgi:hypothetical protein
MKTVLFYFILFFSVCFHIDLYSQSITAKYNKLIVDSLMQIINPNVKLLMIKSDSVLINGTSLSWKYQYSIFSEGSDTNYFFHTTKDSVFYDSLNNLILEGPTYIRKQWIDSDSALTLAESQGGIEFRNTHPNYKITASLGEPLVPNSTPRWYIYYISINNPSDKIFINLDATDSVMSNVKSTEISTDLFLYQNFPNPFNPTTTIKFSIPQKGFVELKVYDLIGREIKTLVKEEKNAGNYYIQFDGSELVSGIYFYKLQFGHFAQTKKFILLK